MVMLFKLSEHHNSVPPPLKMLLYWVQFLSLFPALSTAWPANLLTVLNFTSVFNLDIGYLGAGCDLAKSYYSILTAKLLLPFIFVALLFIFRIVRKLLNSHVFSCLSLFAHMLFVANFFSIQILSSMFQIFNCVDTGSTGYRIAQDPSVSCYDRIWKTFVGLDTVMILFYLLVLPSIVIYIFSRYKRTGDKITFDTLIKPLTHGYRDGAEWFELVRLSFKLGFVLVRDVFNLSLSGKIAFLCLLLLILVWSESNCRPYENPAHHNSLCCKNQDFFFS
jgi:hypothetical protein